MVVFKGSQRYANEKHALPFLLNTDVIEMENEKFLLKKHRSTTNFEVVTLEKLHLNTKDLVVT